eukprot:CAMPEP_0176351458 /NCGR_PEP_ID=MMETSP0126-20121128/10255_1 /TAXON_ID=141414 ORGANISM="Strombidinopsis acuminatum, Strain SPMC142" /NCGR_SAMPLE_ID=MMETSP0126 /ASSEMBLY_ACC=CAM_ASM_000229 /LENGTH=71 /DNA_ID=CAMNT_0017702009 /DNA_START=862 /DNA_END=1077 /DNA_ORIENTATION=-
MENKDKDFTKKKLEKLFTDNGKIAKQNDLLEDSVKELNKDILDVNIKKAALDDDIQDLQQEYETLLSKFEN